jgi:DNA polymerase-3 subunit delta'
MQAEFLLKQYKLGRLSSAYLVNADSIELGLHQIEKFAREILETENLRNSAEYIYVERDSRSKNISIDQIRSAQELLYKTSVISGKKIMVIYGADQMNVNAANSCLKLLEDTPSNSYIFLVTANPHCLLPTILSRCTRINLQNPHNMDSGANISPDFLEVLAKDCDFAIKQQFIEKLLLKDRDMWREFASSAEILLAKFVRYKIGIIGKLENQEAKILLQFKSNSSTYLENKYSKLKILLNNTNEYDLDLRSSMIMLIDLFRE